MTMLTKEAYDNADLDKFLKRENAHELIDYLAQTSNNAAGFGADIFNMIVDKIIFYSRDKMDFLLKDDSTVPWEKTTVREG